MTCRPLVALLTVLPAVALGQRTVRDTALIAPVVVTATRSPIAASKTPATISVVTGAELRREGVVNAADALRRVAGVSLAQTGSYGGATSLFLRGGESKFTKVLVDGVPVNDAGGAFDFSALTTDNIDRIEVVRGPASVLYGSDAVAGVVQLFTRRGIDGSHGELSARGGTFGTHDVDGSVRGASEGLEYSLGGARHETRGIQLFNSGNRDGVLSALVGGTRGAFDARVTARYSDGAFHYPTDGSGQVVDSNAVHREDRLVLGADAAWHVSPSAALRVTLASNDVHGITDDQPDSPGDTMSYNFTTADRARRRSGDVRLDLELPAATRLSVGGQVEREWQESATTSNYGDNGFTATRRNTGAYAQLLLAPNADATATLGARLEHNEAFGDFATWRAAGSAELFAGTRVRASIGTAFREPTFLENYGGAYAIGNPSLTPEHALSVDAGVEQSVGDRLTLGATWFANSFRDLIDYRYSATEPNYFNVARTRSAGLELESRFALDGLHADAEFTYLETRVVDPGTSAAQTAAFAPGARLLRRPMHSLDAGAGYRAARAGLDLRASRVGTREDVYYAPDYSASRVTLPAYTRIDLSADATLVAPERGKGTVTATLRVDNLFDARFSDVAGYNYDFARTDDASLGQTGYRAPGRRILVGARIGM